MRGTAPIITCDHEDGCSDWTIDWYSALASNWRELMAPGWSYNPHRLDDEHFCPEHSAVVGRMNLIEVGVLLNRSVHVIGDDEARILRDAAYLAGASPQLLAAALRLRDQRKAADVRRVAS